MSNSGYTNSSHTNSTDSNSDVFQSLLHKIDSYESYRQCSSSNSLLRNKVYWRELRQIQREGFQDNDQLALQLRAKATLFTQLTKAVTDYSVSSYSGNSSTTGNNSDSTGNYFNNTVTIPKNNVGYLTKSALLESDSSWTSKFTELTKFLLEELLVSYEQELQLLKSHVQMLWRRGTCLLIAITLADNRVKDYEAQLRECCRSYRNDSINTNYAAADIISNSVGNSVGNRGTASPQLAGTNSAPECLTEESIAQDSQGVAENSSTTIDSAGRHANVDGNSVESINSNSVGATSRYNGKDVWILEMKYSVALIRFYQVSEECNKQFGLLFALAKDLEFYRINTITKTAEMFLLKEQELWQQIAVMSSVS